MGHVVVHPRATDDVAPFPLEQRFAIGGFNMVDETETETQPQAEQIADVIPTEVVEAAPVVEDEIVDP